MRARKITLLVAVAAALGVTPLVYPTPSFAADAAAIQPRDGWYAKALVDGLGIGKVERYLPGKRPAIDQQ